MYCTVGYRTSGEKLGTPWTGCHRDENKFTEGDSKEPEVVDSLHSISANVDGDHLLLSKIHGQFCSFAKIERVCFSDIALPETSFFCVCCCVLMNCILFIYFLVNIVC